jgi:hypothetical protein
MSRCLLVALLTVQHIGELVPRGEGVLVLWAEQFLLRLQYLPILGFGLSVPTLAAEGESEMIGRQTFMGTAHVILGSPG